MSSEDAAAPVAATATLELTGANVVSEVQAVDVSATPVVTAVAETSESNEGDIVVAHMNPLPVSDQPLDIEAGLGTRNRAAFVTAAVVKKSPDTPLGVVIKEDSNGTLEISSVKERGILYNSPLRAGDKLLSVNGKTCDEMGKRAVLDFLRQVEGVLTLVAHNPGGEPTLVETMIEKPSVDAVVGIAMRWNERGSLEISKISSTGLFGHSLLNIGDRVLSINSIGSQRLEARAALDIIRVAPQYVTLITETRNTAGVVVAVSSALDEELDRYRHQACFCIWMIVVSLLLVGLGITLSNGGL